MTTPVWPLTLPLVWTNQGTSNQETIATDGSNAASVPTAFRQLSKVPGAVTQITWTFLETEYKTFVHFWKDILLYGQKWFYMQMPVALGIQWCMIRFTDTVFTTAMSGNRKWDVTATIEIRERPIGLPLSLGGTPTPPTGYNPIPPGVGYGSFDIGPILPPPPIPGDPYWDDVILLMHGEGTSGSSIIIDSKYDNIPSILDPGEVTIGNTEGYFDGGYLNFGGFMTSTDSFYQFGSKNVTVEGWFFIPALSEDMAILGSLRSGDFVNDIYLFWVSASGQLQFYEANEGGGDPIGPTSATGVVTAGTWHFISASKYVPTNISHSDNTIDIHCDGVHVANYTGHVHSGSGFSMNIGNYDNTGINKRYEGKMQEFRITVGVSRYGSADYDVPSTRFPEYGV